MLLVGDRAHLLDELQVALEVRSQEARVLSAKVLWVEIVERADPAREEATAERAVGNEADSELAQRRQDLDLRITAPERVLGLQRRDGVDNVCAADGGGRRFRQAEVPHLARFDELGHRADRLLDRRVRVDAVLVVEVDVVNAEPPERGVARLPNVLRVAADAEALAIRPADVAELRGQHDLVAPAGNRPPDELLVREWPIHVGCVEEGHAELERAVDRRDRLALVGAPVELRHAHTAEADLRDLEPTASELACFDALAD